MTGKALRVLSLCVTATHCQSRFPLLRPASRPSRKVVLRRYSIPELVLRQVTDRWLAIGPDPEGVPIGRIDQLRQAWGVDVPRARRTGRPVAPTGPHIWLLDLKAQPIPIRLYAALDVNLEADKYLLPGRLFVLLVPLHVTAPLLVPWPVIAALNGAEFEDVQLELSKCEQDHRPPLTADAEE
ncbi:hypothetical protein GSI_10651 [Ganoderma sinense ZZ0214-1]|uniref:Uncharacterized protein n=1 Tax=Ganoderma sinense ZZ0214-1 TaxID=1077348 RepID=A0A2G8S151_9APHY|nr:hypothetical protein GSI_10651 [Ganoderma sinense ZZ0214-1]